MSSPPPKYLELSREIESLIRNGRWADGKMPGVRDLADDFGVSVMTVSRALQVLRDKGLIQTLDRSGSYLRSSDAAEVAETWAVCLRVTPGPWQQVSSDATMRGLLALGRSRGVQMTYDAFDLAERDLARQAKAAKAAGVGGVFFLPSRISDDEMRLDEQLLNACRASELPVVLLERNLRGEDRPLVADVASSDDADGGRLLTRHLLELGRKKVVFVTGSPTSSHIDRVAGYLYAMHRGGGHEPIVLHQPADLPPRKAYQVLAEQLLERRADAAVCYTDYTAVGVMLELMTRGVHVPADVALAGFDDLPIGTSFAIGVTTYTLPSEGIAAQALRLMRERVRTPDAEPVRVVVPGRMIVRESTVGLRERST